MAVWYLDNESYHTGTEMPWTDQRDFIAQFAPALRAVDPTIKIVVNWRAEPNHWETRELVKAAGQHFDILDMHFYWDWGQATGRMQQA